MDAVVCWPCPPIPCRSPTGPSAFGPPRAAGSPRLRHTQTLDFPPRAICNPIPTIDVDCDPRIKIHHGFPSSYTNKRCGAASFARSPPTAAAAVARCNTTRPTAAVLLEHARACPCGRADSSEPPGPSDPSLALASCAGTSRCRSVRIAGEAGGAQ